MTERPTDVVERLEQWTKLKVGDVPYWLGSNDWADVIRADFQLALDEIRKLRNTTERCSYSPTGVHVYAAFPMGADGRILTVYDPGKRQYPSGSFCQHCNAPAPGRTSSDQRLTVPAA